MQELADETRALDHDPEFVADCIKGDFIQDILQAMDEQGINKSQLAAKWGRKRQYLTGLFNEDHPRNFTIDTIVSLSMTLGLRPMRIEFEKMVASLAMVTLRRRVPLFDGTALSGATWCGGRSDSSCVCANSYSQREEEKPSANSECALAA